jgi:hypothetical protein
MRVEAPPIRRRGMSVADGGGLEVAMVRLN